MTEKFNLNLKPVELNFNNPQSQSKNNVNTFKQIKKQKFFKSVLSRPFHSNQKQSKLDFLGRSRQYNNKNSLSPVDILLKKTKNTQLLNNLDLEYKIKQQNIEKSVQENLNKLKYIYVQKLSLPQLKTKLKQNYYMKRDGKQNENQSKNSTSKQKYNVSHLSQQLNLKKNIIIQQKEWRQSQNQTKDKSGLVSRLSISVIRSYSIQPKSMNVIKGRKQSVMNAYDFRHQNIRLAQRLLTIKPSKGLSRNSQQKFFKKQFFYKELRSNSCEVQNQSQISLSPNLNLSESLPRINKRYTKLNLQNNDSKLQKSGSKNLCKVKYNTISH